MSFFERIFGGGDRQPVEPIVVLGLPIALPVQQILDSLYPLLLFVNQVSVGLAVALLVALALCGCAQFIGGFIGAFKERRSSCGPRSVSPSTMGPVSGNSVSTDSSTRWTTPSKAAAMTVPESMRERLAAALDGMKQTSSKRSNEKSSGSVRRPGILSSSKTTLSGSGSEPTTDARQLSPERAAQSLSPTDVEVGALTADELPAVLRFDNLPLARTRTCSSFSARSESSVDSIRLPHWPPSSPHRTRSSSKLQHPVQQVGWHPRQPSYVTLVNPRALPPSTKRPVASAASLSGEAYAMH